MTPTLTHGVPVQLSSSDPRAPVEAFLKDLARIPDYRVYGRVTAVLGMLVEIGGVERELAVGSRCRVTTRDGRALECEVVGFRARRALVMPFGELEGVGIGCKAEVADADPAIYPDEGWLGRIVNAMGEPIDGKGPLRRGPAAYGLRNRPPAASERHRVAGKIDLGVRAMNAFLTCCRASAWASSRPRASANPRSSPCSRATRPRT